jgi:hypothetical protein
MGLLKWRENPSSLKHNLTAFMTVDGAEIVKVILNNILEVPSYNVIFLYSSYKTH